MALVDKLLTCAECGAEFVFSADEQAFFQDKQFKNDPKRCRACRAKRISKMTRHRIETQQFCAECGIETTVPFKPTGTRPVFCRECFKKRQHVPAPATAPRLHLVKDKARDGPAA